MIVERDILPTLRRLFAQYPIATLTGPRQSGKTTLARTAFADLAYANLESPDQREFATDDPLGFLRQLGTPAVIDEVQRAPELTSYIQVAVDESRETGQYILTGSTQFEVSRVIDQSLAGRTAILRLLPFNAREAKLFEPEPSIERWLHAGFYPRVHEQKLDPTQALGDYFETYVERDVRQVSEIRNLSTFQRFVRLCAGRTGQLLNAQSLGADAGVSHTTAREWLSVLEASYIIFLLRPYHENLSKRLIKSPKLYFHDVGLASYLLGIENEAHLISHPLRGALFENLVVSEALKHRYNRGKRSNLYFFRDAVGHEVDLLYVRGNELLTVEIKSGETIATDSFKGLRYLQGLLGDRIAHQALVYGGEKSREQSGVRVCSVAAFSEFLAEFDA